MVLIVNLYFLLNVEQLVLHQLCFIGVLLLVKSVIGVVRVKPLALFQSYKVAAVIFKLVVIRFIVLQGDIPWLRCWFQIGKQSWFVGGIVRHKVSLWISQIGWFLAVSHLTLEVIFRLKVIEVILEDVSCRSRLMQLTKLTDSLELSFSSVEIRVKVVFVF